jgi:glucarate dehydratase
MLHLGAALPNLSFAADAHYHHLTDDVIAGGKMKYVNGCIAVPTVPGLGVSLDREKVGKYAELYKSLGTIRTTATPSAPSGSPSHRNDALPRQGNPDAAAVETSVCVCRWPRPP